MPPALPQPAVDPRVDALVSYYESLRAEFAAVLERLSVADDRAHAAERAQASIQAQLDVHDAAVTETARGVAEMQHDVDHLYRIATGRGAHTDLTGVVEALRGHLAELRAVAPIAIVAPPVAAPVLALVAAPEAPPAGGVGWSTPQSAGVQMPQSAGVQMIHAPMPPGAAPRNVTGWNVG